MVGDDDCVIVIPAHLADEIAEETVEMTAFEDFVVERVREGASIIGLYPPTKEENQEAFAQWRKRVGR
jgi:regulator of RNase E activity RraA